jgi:dihydroneopterin aldolase
MPIVKSIDYKAIIEIVRGWPPASRFSLVQDVLKTLAPEVENSRSKRNTLEKALGLLATSQSAPSDAEVQQWLDEHRMEKYG